MGSVTEAVFGRVLGCLLSGVVVVTLTAQENPSESDLASFDHIEHVSVYERSHTFHAGCRGSLVDRDGEPIAGALIQLCGFRSYFWALPYGQTRSAADGTFAFEDVSGKGDLGLWITSPADGPFWKTFRTVRLVSGHRTQLRPIACDTTPAEGTEDAKAMTLRGVVRGGEASPIGGLYVRAEAEGEAFDPSAVAVTAADGSFEIVARTGRPKTMSLFLPRRRIRLAHSEGVAALAAPESRWEREWKVDFDKPLELTHERFVECVVEAVGLEDGVAAVFETERGGQWFDCGGARVPLYRDHEGDLTGAYIRARAPGRVARVAWVKEPHRFDFSKDVLDTVVVTGWDGPIEGARVEVVGADAGGTDRVLSTFRSDAAGKVRVFAPPGQKYTVWIYADEHEPARVDWVVGEGARAVLRGLDDLHVAITETMLEGSLDLRPVGQFSAVRVEYPSKVGVLAWRVPPGDYELTSYSAEGVAAVKKVSTPASADAPVRIEGDARPQVRVKLPRLELEGKWWAHGGRSAVGGMITRWMASSGGRNVATRELFAQVEPFDGGFTLRFPTSGRYTILLGHEKLEHRLFRDVRLAFGDELEFDVPALDAKLAGTCATYPELWAMGAQHGIAGPRLMLLPHLVDGTTWGVLHALPEAAEFEIAHLPSGRYHLAHHLYETGWFSSDDGSFGSVPVELTAGARVHAGKLEKGPKNELRVRVVDAKGQPITGRLAVRDRMFESWSKVVERGTTLRNAMDPIPSTPAVELDAAGRGKLPNIATGRLEFVLSMADGREVRFARVVEPGKELEVVLGVD